MAKRNNDDWTKALTIAALKRAISVVEGSMADPSTRLEEAAYPVALTVEIEGDVTVGPAVPAGPRTRVPSLSPAEILAGIVATRKRPVDALRLLEAGMKRASAAKGKGAEVSLRELVDKSGELILDTAKREKCTKLTGTAARAGKVEGKPGVRISGASDRRTISVEVAAA